MQQISCTSCTLDLHYGMQLVSGLASGAWGLEEAFVTICLPTLADWHTTMMRQEQDKVVSCLLAGVKRISRNHQLTQPPRVIAAAA